MEKMINYYTVEFRLYGASLDTELVTRELGVKPSTVQKIGERAGAGRKFRESALGLSKTNSSGGIIEWASLQEGLEEVLDLLEPLRSKIDALDSSLKRVFWCGLFIQSIGVGPRVDSATLTRIAAVDAAIELSIYYCEESSD